MPRSNPIDRLFGLSPEQRVLARYNEVARLREQAVATAREHGLVRLPPHWPGTRSDRVVVPTHASIATRYVPLPRLELSPSPLSDALDARRALVNANLDGPDLAERASAHDLATRRSQGSTVEPHVGDSAFDLGPGAPIAIVTSMSGSERTRWRRHHVARLGATLADDLQSHDLARATAHRLLTTSPVATPLALVASRDGTTRVAEVALPAALVDADCREPLVASVAGTATTLEWRRSSAALVAVIGIDGVRWM